MTKLEEPVVKLTNSALIEVNNLITNTEDYKNKSLRIFVESGGCSGLQYGMTFDEIRDDDLVYEYESVSVVIDNFSANYIKDAELDYSYELMGGGFKFNNPNAASTCGCGKSFN